MASLIADTTTSSLIFDRSPANIGSVLVTRLRTGMRHSYNSHELHRAQGALRREEQSKLIEVPETSSGKDKPA